MRIAFLVFSALPNAVGGAQIFTFNLIQAFLKRSHEVYLFLPRKYFVELAEVLPSNQKGFKIIPICYYENGLSRFFPFAIYISLLVRQIIYKYDIWQVIGAYPAGFVARWLSHRVPVVLRSHGADVQKDEALHYGLRLNPVFEKRIKAAVNNMTSLVALTPTVKECYLDLGAKAEKIVEIPNAIDLSRFQHPVDRTAIRCGFGIQDDHIFILTTGRYHVKKGYEYIPESAKILVGKGFNIRWLIVGKGVTALRKMVKQMDLEDIVILKDGIGVQKHLIADEMVLMPPKPLIDLYRSADIYVMPSLLETFGMVLIEAMACGLPIVATDAPGCRDVIDNEINGLHARPADPVNLAACIERILTDDALRQKIKSNALNAAKEYDWRHIVRKYESLYLDIIRG